MTFTYSKHVSSVHLLGFFRLLFIWRASIYKLVFREMIIYCVLYAGLSMLYRLLLSPDQRKIFEQIVVFCSCFEDALPLTFILGFYVSFVANRWWQQFSNIAWPDRIMTYITTMVDGDSERATIIRRTLIRYLFLSQCLLMRSISSPVRKRFPDLQSFIEHGIMTEDELKALNDERVPTIANNYWVPMHWFTSLIVRARDENFIRDSYSFNALINELTVYKTSLKNVMLFDMINVPLGYTQVATISVYGFSLITLLSRQFIDWTSINHTLKTDPSLMYCIDMYFPVFTLLQLFFYIGWLNVAEQMLNPFGEDDDDFECNWILDRNFTIGYCGVDALFRYHPPLFKDPFWKNFDANLTYTVDSEKYRLPDGWHGSAHVPNEPTSLLDDKPTSNSLLRRKSRLIIVSPNNPKRNSKIPRLSFDDKSSLKGSKQSIEMKNLLHSASTPSFFSLPSNNLNLKDLPSTDPMINSFDLTDHVNLMEPSAPLDVHELHLLQTLDEEDEKKCLMKQELFNCPIHSSSVCELSIIGGKSSGSSVQSDHTKLLDFHKDTTDDAEKCGASLNEISISQKSCNGLDSDSIV